MEDVPENLEKPAKLSRETELLLKVCKKKMERAVEWGGPNLSEKIFNFSERLKHKYSDYADYYTYHVLIGSTPRGDLPKVDFPGEDSVKKFIESL